MKFLHISEGVKRYIDNVELDYQVTIHYTHPLLMVNKSKSIYSYYFGPEIKEWIKGKKYSVSSQGYNCQIRMTKQDMALFRLFFC